MLVPMLWESSELFSFKNSRPEKWKSKDMYFWFYGSFLRPPALPLYTVKFRWKKIPKNIKVLREMLFIWHWIDMYGPRLYFLLFLLVKLEVLFSLIFLCYIFFRRWIYSKYFELGFLGRYFEVELLYVFTASCYYDGCIWESICCTLAF